MYLGQTQNMLMYYLFKLWNRTRVKKNFGKKLIHNKMKKKSFSLIYGIIIQKPRKSAFCNFSFFQFYVFDIRFLFFLFYSIVRGPQKFENIFPLVLTSVFLSTKGKNSSNFVTFSQYLNFNNLIAHALKRHRSGVLLWRQILKRQLLHQMFVRKLLFLVCCFFSVIWNISIINVFKTKCKLRCQNEYFGKLFLKSGNTSVYFLSFLYWDLSDEHLTR